MYNNENNHIKNNFSKSMNDDYLMIKNVDFNNKIIKKLFITWKDFFEQNIEKMKSKKKKDHDMIMNNFTKTQTTMNKKLKKIWNLFSSNETYSTRSISNII